MYRRIGWTCFAVLLSTAVVPDRSSAQSASLRIAVVDSRRVLDSMPGRSAAEAEFGLEQAKARTMVRMATDSMKSSLGGVSAGRAGDDAAAARSGDDGDAGTGIDARGHGGTARCHHRAANGPAAGPASARGFGKPSRSSDCVAATLWCSTWRRRVVGRQRCGDRHHVRGHRRAAQAVAAAPWRAWVVVPWPRVCVASPGLPS
jgi:hypothetical protein